MKTIRPLCLFLCLVAVILSGCSDPLIIADTTGCFEDVALGIGRTPSSISMCTDRVVCGVFTSRVEDICIERKNATE